MFIRVDHNNDDVTLSCISVSGKIKTNLILTRWKIFLSDLFRLRHAFCVLAKHPCRMLSVSAEGRESPKLNALLFRAFRFTFR